VADLYSTIKGRLLSAHQLADFQRAEALFHMPALSGQKSSQLMAAMLEVCPRGSEKCILFLCLFLRRLPRQLRVLLARADLSDLKGLAEQVDKLWTHHAFEDLVAAVQQLFTEEESIAAFRPGGSGAQGTKGVPWKKKGGKNRRPRSPPSGGRRGRRLVSASLTGAMVPLRRGATLFAPGQELRSQGQVNTVIPCCLLHIKEDISNRCFLIDTGTSYSVFPYTSMLPSLGPRSKVLSGQPI
jgi:hypothetical protein